jgi:hypothetical protein
MTSKSNSERISRQEEVDEFFEQIGIALSRPVQVLLIGGAAMLEFRLKESTKDIDIVCKTEKDKDEILRCTQGLGYELVGPKERHARLGLNRIAIKGGRTLDVFAGRISYDFGLSDAMWKRARKIKSFYMAEVRYASLGDIFIMKLIANREGDAPDCASLVSAGLDFDVVFDEIESQYRKVSENRNQKMWITYLEEGVGRLEEDYGMDIPIADKISVLADEYRERLYQDLTD